MMHNSITHNSITHNSITQREPVIEYADQRVPSSQRPVITERSSANGQISPKRKQPAALTTRVGHGNRAPHPYCTRPDIAKRLSAPAAYSAPTGPAPVEARLGNYRSSFFERRCPLPPLVSKPGSHRYRTGGEPEGREVFRATGHGTEMGMRETSKSGQNATN
jgi:hypothetical protein